jgi:hypothetical protein
MYLERRNRATKHFGSIITPSHINPEEPVFMAVSSIMYS